MKKWCFLLAALLLIPLSACGGIEDESYLRGRVAEVQRDSDGSPSALILDTGDGEREGVFWDEYTSGSLPGGGGGPRRRELPGPDPSGH